MPITLKTFQDEVCSGIVARLREVAALYRQMANRAPAEIDAARKRDGAVVLQAPTGAGKTVIAVEALRRLAREERVLWFWFAPFSGLVEQSRGVIAAHAPELRLLDLDSERRLDAVNAGGVFVTTWASVAARNADSRRARTTGDAGLALDTLIAAAREEGVRIGCVVDEAHHSFLGAAQARAFFTDVLKPDFALMMTATPRDRDALAFEQVTGYRIGQPADWASVSRTDAVEAGLLKRGVRMVRFVARDGDNAQLVDFEHLALRECAAMHRHIQKELNAQGVPLTPLMLVQVPDGKAAIKDARNYLVEKLKFAESAVREHTADEPDADLIALANDPTVEVLLFKMAVALGFDAPRAATLAALRGARDAGFGVQVIGRIVRRHALLQARTGLPELLDHGYVFLANAASQEGLLDAGAQINALDTRAPELGTQTVLTVIGNTQQVQVVRNGEPLSLLVDAQSATPVPAGADANAAPAGSGDVAGGEMPQWTQAARDLLQEAGDEGAGDAPPPAGEATPAGRLLMTSAGIHRYPRRANAPAVLRTERLPKAPEDYEAKLVDFVDFNHQVLADRLRTNVQVQRSEADVFDGHRVAQGDADVFAELAPEAVAERAEQIRLRLTESNDRDLLERLTARFAKAIRDSGAAVPEDEEQLAQQLDLVIVRNPRLLREAFTRFRQAQVMDLDAPLPPELQSDSRLAPASRAMYGVFPPGMNEDESAIASMLDSSPLVQWWHRNPSDHRRADALGLYRWDDGDGFYPDFVVSIGKRETPGGIALLEIKGAHLWGNDHEADKAQARHTDYGQVFMVGRPRGETQFVHLRRLQDRLTTDGTFGVDRLQHI